LGALSVPRIIHIYSLIVLRNLKLQSKPKRRSEVLFDRRTQTSREVPRKRDRGPRSLNFRCRPAADVRLWRRQDAARLWPPGAASTSRDGAAQHQTGSRPERRLGRWSLRPLCSPSSRTCTVSERSWLRTLGALHAGRKDGLRDGLGEKVLYLLGRLLARRPQRFRAWTGTPGSGNALL